MSTLSASGHLYEMHRHRSSYDLEIRFFNQRLRQIRRSERAQRFLLFLLRLRDRLRFYSLFCRGSVVVPSFGRAIHTWDEASGRYITTTNVRPLQEAVALRLRAPKQFSILTLRGKPYIVRNTQRFLFWHILDLIEKLN